MAILPARTEIATFTSDFFFISGLVLFFIIRVIEGNNLGLATLPHICIPNFDLGLRCWSDTGVVCLFSFRTPSATECTDDNQCNLAADEICCPDKSQCEVPVDAAARACGKKLVHSPAHVSHPGGNRSYVGQSYVP